MTPESRAPLFAPIRSLPGVTPERERQLERLGLARASDLLFFFPRDYRPRPRFTRIADLEFDVEQMTYGRLAEFRTSNFSRGAVANAVFEDDAGDRLRAVWFNMPSWMFRQFQLDRRALITAKPGKDKRGRLQISHPALVWLDDDDDLPFDGVENVATPALEAPPEDDTLFPVYPLTEGLKQYQIHRLMKEILETLPDLVDDVFPDEYREAHNLLPIAEALRKIHLPKDEAEAELARRRFIYQEFLLLQLALAIRRQQHEVNLQAPAIRPAEDILLRLRRLVPYELTGAQTRVIREITADMTRPVPMNRLLQGDVGSGKTIVAAAAILQAVAEGYQAVIMAPTEILARQHLRFLTRLFESMPIEIVPFLGGQKPKTRQEILEKIESGAASIVVGTQAIIYANVRFRKLGLVVIDEQHKFGVRQRAQLKTGTGADPHYLVMTATPIPRSMTMTVFGDLDISILDQLPPGRQPIRTYVVTQEKKERWWAFFRRKIEEGRQGYVVVPRVDETDEGLKDVESVFGELSAGPLAGLRLGIVHGRMTPEEKDRIMADFRSREIEVLIATSVIEVGVDVPNATLISIENANMFGLAQLHQLRGRIGRGKYPGFCGVLLGDETEEAPLGQGTLPAIASGRPRNAPEARLKIFADSSDGFFLAEKDFEMRGPGDLFGTEQHGLCRFHIADILRDRKILEEARADAALMIRSDPGLAADNHRLLRDQVLRRYGLALNLGDVG
ncbi:MAG: ATP-dependent DNA helicase RecG [Thermoguttaceae bacterium]|nr:ATP-dependent DNA helicase RecG [Thermoguttaceae bacterium]